MGTQRINKPNPKGRLWIGLSKKQSLLKNLRQLYFGELSFKRIGP